MKTGESVIINKPNHKADGLGGTIVSINDETKRIKVNLDCGLEWGFNHNEVVPTAGKNNPVETIKPKETGIISPEKIKPVKRAYSKRCNKPKEVKEKRKYTKKVKP